MAFEVHEPISVIIPTLGRPDMLRLCLESLVKQTVRVAEVLIVHCGDDLETKQLTKETQWCEEGITIRYLHYPERNVAHQRELAISRAKYDNLLLLDDDVELDDCWVEELFKPIWADNEVGATMGCLVNQTMPSPTLLWRVYRFVLHGKEEGFRMGRLVGAALPNGFQTDALELIPCEWIGGGASALRREAYLSVGGFASYFTGSSPGEDLDLGYRLSRKWKVYYVPSAKCIHHQALSGRERSDRHQYLSMRSRFGILTVSMKKHRLVALGHIALWAAVQGLSELASLRRGVLRSDLLYAWWGRLRGFLSCLRWHPEHTNKLHSE
jgi:GT2 family glycosyltransferase